MLSVSAQEKLSRYQYVLMERDHKLSKTNDESKRHEIVMIYSPPINMLACAFADQVLEDGVTPHKP